MPTFSDVRPPSRSSMRFTKQTFYSTSEKWRSRFENFGRPGSGQLGRDVICEGCSIVRCCTESQLMLCRRVSSLAAMKRII